MRMHQRHFLPNAMPGGILRTVKEGIFPGETRRLSVSSVAVIGGSWRVIVGVVAKLKLVMLMRGKEDRERCYG